MRSLAFTLKRGVNVVLFTRQLLGTQLPLLFQSKKIAYEVMLVQTNVIAVDDDYLALGSYNWLGKKHTKTKAETLVIESALLTSLFLDLGLQSGANQHCVSEYTLGEPANLSVISSHEQHRAHLIDLIQDAQSRVVICLPHIWSIANISFDFDRDTLNHLEQKQVELIFVCKIDDPRLDEFRQYFEQCYSLYISVITLDHIQTNTVIIDDDKICEGTINWFNDSQAHDTSILITVSVAVELVTHFNASHIGRKITEHFASPTLSSLSPSLSGGYYNEGSPSL